jgi:hypothetical protein
MSNIPLLTDQPYNPYDNQVDRNNVIQQPRDDEDQYASDERKNGVIKGHEDHGAPPCLFDIALSSMATKKLVKTSRKINPSCPPV